MNLTRFHCRGILCMGLNAIIILFCTVPMLCQAHNRLVHQAIARSAALSSSGLSEFLSANYGEQHAPFLNSPTISFDNPIGLGPQSPVDWIIGLNADTYNVWSWKNARDYEWDGLTDRHPADRHNALANVFRSVGQVMHLLQDTTSPQHVRNEQHLFGSRIEKYGRDHIRQPVYTHSVLDWRGAGFTKLEDFWNRHIYGGNPAALDADSSGGANTLGLAEWCNGNFLGQRHIYAEYFKPGDVQNIVKENGVLKIDSF